MFITAERYKELMTTINCQEQIIEEHKKENDMLIEEYELKSQLNRCQRAQDAIIQCQLTKLMVGKHATPNAWDMLYG